MTTVLHASTTHHDIWKGPKRYVRIIIHDNVDEFRTAADAYSPQSDFSGATGCFHPAIWREKFNEEKKRWEFTGDKHYAGTIRLADEHITYNVLTHESVHAAAHIWRMDVTKAVHLGWNCARNEEWFAYIVGDLTQQVIAAVAGWDNK